MVHSFTGADSRFVGIRWPVPAVNIKYPCWGHPKRIDARGSAWQTLDCPFRFGIRKGLFVARINRREVLANGEIQVVHCVNRCVRRGFLCGTDELTGQNYEHRREWIRNRLEFLAGSFGIDILGVSVMSNPAINYCDKDLILPHRSAIRLASSEVGLMWCKTGRTRRLHVTGGTCFRLVVTKMVRLRNRQKRISSP